MDIVEELRNDRERGARRLESEYRAGLMTLARRFCADEGDAEELVNRTFAAVVEGIDDYIEQSAFFAWMCRILSNIHAKDGRRKMGSAVVADPAEVDAAADLDADQRIFREVDAGLLRDAIRDLPPGIRNTLLLHYFMDIPVCEVARVLSVPSGTVKWRLHYARMILAGKLGAAARKPGAKMVLLALLLAAGLALGRGVYALAAAALSSHAESAAVVSHAESAKGAEFESHAEFAENAESANSAEGGFERAQGAPGTPANPASNAADGGMEPSNSSTIQTIPTMKPSSLLAATASLALAASPAVAGDWVLDMNAKTLTYKDWVFTISGTEDRLAIASVKSYPQVVTDIDFSTIQSDTGATPVSAGRLFYGVSNGSAGRFVGKVVLAPTLETVAAGFLAYSTATNLVIPSGSVLTAIPQSFMSSAASCAFDYSTLPATVTDIGDAAFSSAYEGFGVLRIPAACRRIGNNAFSGGRSGGKMAGLVFEEGSDCESIGSGAFNQNNLSGSVAMPATLRSIGDKGFCYSKITSVSFPDDSRLESIGSQAFYSTGLSGINLPGGLVSLGAEAFSTCRNLSGSMTIPSGIRRIGNLTFFDCRKLQEVVFENGCSYIGTNVFANCTSLTNLVLPRTLKALGGGAFVGGYSSYAQWQAMKKGDIWWQSCPTIEDDSGLFAYCNASNGGRAGDIVNHLSFAKWSGYASAHPDTFLLDGEQNGVGTWTSPAAGATGSAIASIVNWENNPTVIVVR